MNLRFVVISAACLSVCVVPTTATSLLAATAAVKGAILGAGLTALKTRGSETVIIQSGPGSVAEVVPANHVIVQDNVHKPVSVQTGQSITFTSSNPFSSIWGAVSNFISAKTKAIGNLFSPNRVVVILPHTTTEKTTSTTTTTTTTTTPKPTTQKTTEKSLITIDVEHHPLKVIGIEVDHKPITLPSLEVSLGGGPYRGVPMAVVNYLKKK